MKTLKFREELSKLILDGKKTTTWRLFDEKNISANDNVTFLVWETKKEFAKAKILDIKEKTFDKLTEDDWLGHERFSSDEEMFRLYSKFYGRHVDKSTVVKIIKFKLL